MICALLKARALLALFLWVFSAPTEGGRSSAGLGHLSPFLPCNMRALKCTFAFFGLKDFLSPPLVLSPSLQIPEGSSHCCASQGENPISLRLAQETRTHRRSCSSIR